MHAHGPTIAPLVIRVKKTAGFYFFFFLLAFMGAAMTEEFMKYTIVQRVRKSRPEFRDW
jgi:hypothetical protein